tara:strand:+ start:1859 stop:2686 length:828 start_codon:yes stop_codon:yes gene_type:complete
MINYKNKYLKYKKKYLKEKNKIQNKEKNNLQKGGSDFFYTLMSKTKETLGISSCPNASRIYALKYFKNELEKMTLQIKEISKKYEENKENLEKQIMINKDLKDISPELIEIKETELEKLKAENKEKLNETPSSRLHTQINEEYRVKILEEEKKLEEELDIIRNGYSFQLLVNEQTIEDLKNKIKSNNKQLITLEENLDRYNKNIEEIREHLEGNLGFSEANIKFLEDLEHRMRILKEEIQDVDLKQDDGYCITSDDLDGYEGPGKDENDDPTGKL